jgi:hypothetical protein
VQQAGLTGGLLRITSIERKTPNFRIITVAGASAMTNCPGTIRQRVVNCCEALEQRILLLDGAMGTMIQAAAVRTRLSRPALCRSRPRPERQ